MAATYDKHKATITESSRLVSDNVRVLMALARETHQDVADALGLVRPAVSARLNGRTPWSLQDLDHLAQHFRVSAATFLQPAPDISRLQGPGGLLDPIGRRRRASTPHHRRDSRARLLRSRDGQDSDDDAQDEPGVVAV